jgi:diguanylate cyclase (GGDEF)-like protein
MSSAPVAEMGRRATRGIRLYVTAVSAVGLGVLALLAATGSWDRVAHHGAEFGLFAALAVLGELVPIRMPGRSSEDEVTVSTAFAFALLLAFGPAPAVAVYAAASVVDSLVYRPPWTRAIFNAGQYALSLAAAAGVMTLLSHVPTSASTVATDIPAILLAGGAYFVVNNVLAGTAPALAHNVNVLQYLRRDLMFQAATTGILLTLAPVIVASADAGLALVPLLSLPILAVYLAGRQSLINDYRASHDLLTDLPNRWLLHERLEHDIAAARRTKSSIAVLLIDLDDFKEVNDTLGHHHGDLLLEQIGPRIRSVLSEDVTLARLGGDEFAAVLPRVIGLRGAFSAARRVLEALEEPFPLEGLHVDVRATIGIACFPEHGDDVETLIQHADVALYRAKESRTHYEAYAPAEDDYSRERLVLAGQLRRGIDRGELVLHYQPKVAAADGRLAGVEALVRWRHPQLGLISPDGFIPLAEHTGLIRPLTAQVVEASVSQFRAWRDMGLELRLAVNLSTRNLLDRELANTLVEILARYQVPPPALQLEITESALMADSRATAAVKHLRDLGIGLVIDDFGTGYSSLTYLKALPVDEIKIDKSFVLNMHASAEDSAIVKSTIELGRNLGLKTTVEGVENEAVWTQLREWGCDFVQGNYFGHPAPGAELTDLLDRSRRPRMAHAALSTLADGDGPATVSELPGMDEVAAPVAVERT